MSDIKRYTTDVCGQLIQCDRGELVHYQELSELKAKYDELLAALRDIVTAYRELACDEAEPVMHRIASEAIAKHSGQQ